MYRHAVLIYNPVAGTLKSGGNRLIEKVREALARSGHIVSFVPTRGAGTASAMARESVASGADLILAFGGDGTINEIAEGMIGSPIPLGILPGGTANVIASELQLGRTPHEAASRLGDWRPERISVGQVRTGDGTTRHFLAMAGIGLDAHIVYGMNADRKKKWGKLAYWMGGFAQLVRKLEEFDVEVDGRVYPSSFALITKVRNYGGDLEIARCVKIVDDEFEVVLFSGNRATRYLKYLTGVAANRLDGMSGVTILRTREATLRHKPGERVHMQIDGEYAGRLPGTVKMVPDALTLLTPASYVERKA